MKLSQKNVSICGDSFFGNDGQMKAIPNISLFTCLSSKNLFSFCSPAPVFAVVSWFSIIEDVIHVLILDTVVPIGLHFDFSHYFSKISMKTQNLFSLMVSNVVLLYCEIMRELISNHRNNRRYSNDHDQYCFNILVILVWEHKHKPHKRVGISVYKGTGNDWIPFFLSL